MLKDYDKGNKKDKRQKEAILFIKQKIDSAKWFIDMIKQRQETLINTMSAIMKHQREFFLTGDETTMKPMILKDIAELTGLGSKLMLSKTSKIVIAFTLVIIAMVSVAMPALAQTNTPSTPAESTFDWSAIYPALQNLLILLLTGLGALVARWVNAQYHLARGKLDENQTFHA